MTMVAPTYSPKRIEELTGISPDVLRDWRRRDLIRGFGEEGDNGRWLYSLHDVTIMASALILNRTGVDLKYCFWMASNAALSIIRAAVALDYDSFTSRYHFFWLATVGNPRIRTVGFELQHEQANAPAPRNGSRAPMMMTIDVEAFDAALPKPLVSELSLYVDRKG